MRHTITLCILSFFLAGCNATPYTSSFVPQSYYYGGCCNYGYYNNPAYNKGCNTGACYNIGCCGSSWR